MTPEQRSRHEADAKRAMMFMVAKFAVFGLLPMILAALYVYVTL